MELSSTSKVKDILEVFLVMVMLFNVFALSMTVYMLTYHGDKTYETNAFPAWVIASGGFAPLILVCVLLWLTIFWIVESWEKRYGLKRRIMFQGVLIIMILPLVSWDFSNNIAVMIQVLL